MTGKELMKRLVRTKLEGAIRDQRQAWAAAERIQSITGDTEDLFGYLIELADRREYEEPTEQELDQFIRPANRSESLRKLLRPEVEAAVRLQRQSWETLDRIQEITGLSGHPLCDFMELCERHRNDEEILEEEIDFFFPDYQGARQG